MDKLVLKDLLAASRAGGASSLAMTTEMSPAAGAHAGVAPAKYVSGENPTYLFQTRFVDGEPQRTVLLDSKGSSLNRVEEQIVNAIKDGEQPLARTPRIVVHYPDADLMCLELPHRAFDGHARAGTIAGKAATSDDRYRQLRDASPANARALLETSPQSLVFGAWDSTRKSNQGRYRSALVGEVIGVLAEQGPDADTAPKSGGARSDSYSPSVQLSAEEMESLLAAQEDELSAGLVAKIRKEISKEAKNRDGKPISGSGLVLGSIPPTLNGLGVVACRRIIRTHLLSFSTLRALRFGAGADGDVACRALLAAYALAGVARVMADPRLRANCDLIEKAAPVFALDARYGEIRQIAPLTVSDADGLLSEAIDRAQSEAGIQWAGQILDIEGNPLIAQAKSDEDQEKA